jgi:hypothetical protein
VNLQSLNTHSIARGFLASVVVLAGAFAALTFAGPAAASACGDKVLADWFDNGRIDRLYPPHCYEDAIDAIPRDIGPYSDAEDVITRALQSSLRGELAPGGRDPTPGDDDPKNGGPKTPNNPNDPTNPNDPSDPNNPPQAAPDVDTSGPSSVPIPLLVLGGMSLALLAAGGLGYVSRRRQAAHADDLGDDTLI